MIIERRHFAATIVGTQKRFRNTKTLALDVAGSTKPTRGSIRLVVHIVTTRS